MTLRVGMVSRLNADMKGDTHYTRVLAEGFASLREEVDVRYYTTTAEDPVLPGARVERVWPFDHPRWGASVVAQAREDRCDVVHLQHEFTMFGGARGNLGYLGALRALRAARIPVVATLHHVVAPGQVDARFVEAFRPGGGAFRGAVRFALGKAFRATLASARQVIVHDEVFRRVLLEAYGADPARVGLVHVPVGEPPREAGPGGWAARLQGQRVVLAFGYLMPRKGLEHLLDAFAGLSKEFPDARLVLAGGVPEGHQAYVQGLDDRARSLGVADRVVRTGFLPDGRDVHDLFRAAGVCAFPYVLSVASSLPLTYAAMHGKPVVASDLGCFREELRDGVSGLLVPPAEPAVLGKALREVLADATLAASLGRGLAKAAEPRRAPAVARATLEVYRRAREVPP